MATLEGDQVAPSVESHKQVLALQADTDQLPNNESVGFKLQFKSKGKNVKHKP